jgi:hypothetical protein
MKIKTPSQDLMTTPRPSKTKAMLTALPLTIKVCSTCSFWAGSREVRPGGEIEIHPYSKGECRGDIFKNLAMAALATCNQWQGLQLDIEKIAL